MRATTHSDTSTCLLCDSASFKPLVGKQGCRYVKCRHCGFVWVTMDDGNPSIPYEEGYYFFDERRRVLDSARARQFFDLIRDSIPENGKLLDVGCGKGFFIKVAREHGCDAYGIDISETAVGYAKEELGLQNVVSGELEEADYPDSHFDVITIWELIEHLYDPMPVLGTAKRILKKDGCLFLSTPNMGSIYAKVFGKKWHGYGIPQYHRIYCNPETIRILLEKAGFGPPSVWTIAPPQLPMLLADNFSSAFAPWRDKKIIGRISKGLCFHAFRQMDNVVIKRIASWGNMNDTMIVAAKPHEAHFPSYPPKHFRIDS